ncbi:hypothetical protein H312_03135, partial [Anncaliia algerae PRA339]
KNYNNDCEPLRNFYDAVDNYIIVHEDFSIT